MRQGHNATRSWTSALLALLSLLPAAALRAEPSPCSTAPRAPALRPEAACSSCCGQTPAPVTLPSVRCGCCLGAPQPAPARTPSPAVDPLFMPTTPAGTVAGSERRTTPSGSRPTRREATPPARLLHCVHLI